ncbi:hypothetical protein D3C78_1220710 [compost metagenome]
MILTGSHLIVPDPFTQHVRHGREWHHESGSRTVGLNDRYVQVTAQGTWENIRQRKRARRHVGAVYGVAVLADLDAGVGRRHATHYRRIAALAFRQHVVGAGNLHAAELDAVEHVVVGVGLANHHAATQGNNVSFCPARNGIPMSTGTRLLVQRRVIAQTPITNVETVVQAQEVIV